MANIKISQLTNASTLDGEEYVLIVQNGEAKKTSTRAVANLGGGGGVTEITFNPVKVFDENGIGASSWSSGGSLITIDGGTYTATPGEKVVVDSTNMLRMSMPISGSYYMFGIKCKVDPSFVPINTGNWYGASCILGQELGGEQRDFGIVIDSSGYFALGWATATITSSTVSALDGNVHELLIVAESGKIRLFIDGVEEVAVDKGMSGTHMSDLGIFWNKSSESTRVNGEIYAVGCWSEVEPSFRYVLPTL